MAGKAASVIKQLHAFLGLNANRNFVTRDVPVKGTLGLFGLASYMAEDRTREIGVRKVLGASVYEISFLFSQEFMKWVLLANVLAWPLSYFIVNKVLEEYSNRIPFLWWTLPVALLLSAGMAIATVSYQSIRAARGNPVDALKHE